MNAFLFPGQASQYVGMAKDLYDFFPEVRKIYREANKILPFDLIDISFNGPIEKLTETDITQPAVFTHSYVVYFLIKKYIHSDIVAGHSLGEFMALVAAEVLSFVDALEIVANRGKLMKECNEENPGTMAAILKVEQEKVRTVCNTIDEVVQIANINSDTQIVISGTVNGVKQAMNMLKKQGAKIVKELQVGGAFHSPLMKPAEKELAKIINTKKYNNAVCDVYTNVLARPERNGEKLRELSIKQLTSSVLWYNIVTNMLLAKVNTFYELGPGAILSGLLKRMKKEITIQAVSTLEQFENTIQ